MTRSETIEKAVGWALAAAEDPGHGYDQQKRWGPDYDCSSFVIAAWEAAGVPLRAQGACYTGNMLPAMLALGFRDVKDSVDLRSGAGLEKGDVLLNTAHHTELYAGGGKTVRASLNEFGGITGGLSGDQTGREVCVGAYWLPGYGWDAVLRYAGVTEDGGPSRTPAPTSPKEVTEDGLDLPQLARGDRGISVLAMQAVLIARGCGCGPDGADGDFGANTEGALRRFQRERGLEADGICGRLSWAALLGVIA